MVICVERPLPASGKLRWKGHTLNLEKLRDVPNQTCTKVLGSSICFSRVTRGHYNTKQTISYYDNTHQSIKGKGLWATQCMSFTWRCSFLNYLILGWHWEVNWDVLWTTWTKETWKAPARRQCQNLQLKGFPSARHTWVGISASRRATNALATLNLLKAWQNKFCHLFLIVVQTASKQEHFALSYLAWVNCKVLTRDEISYRRFRTI